MTWKQNFVYRVGREQNFFLIINMTNKYFLLSYNCYFKVIITLLLSYIVYEKDGIFKKKNLTLKLARKYHFFMSMKRK